MKKKVFLNGRFLSQQITGVQRTAFELVKALDILIESNSADFSSFQYVLIHPKLNKDPFPFKHIKTIQKGRLQGNLWEQFELPYYTRGSLLISMCMVSTLVKRKQIVIIHDASVFVNPHFFSAAFKTWYKFAIKHLGKIAKHIITVSEFSKHELIRYAGIKTSKISVIPNAGEHILTYGEANNEFKRKIDALSPFLLAVSSLGANKNFNGLAEAINLLNLAEYKMIIAGGVQNTLKHSPVESSVIYLGYVSNEELKYLYSKASLFIFPSFYEGFGIPPLEAMVSGCPVLSSNTSSLPEVLESASAFCDPYSVTDIAEKIEMLIADKNLLTVLREDGKVQADKYSWIKSSSQLHTLCQQFYA